MNWIEEVNKEQDSFNEILSFEKYLEVFEKNAHLECRPNCKYLKDMFDYFGRNERKGFNLFLRDMPNSPPVFGQFKAQNAIYQNISNFLEEGFNNKFILLVGPNGSSKTSIIRKVMEGAEEYSKSKEGALYSFSWIFPIDSFVKGSLGLNTSQQTGNLSSYAYLEDKDISSILTSELKDHPILLLPKEFRQKLIQKTLYDFPDHWELAKKSYLYQGDLSKRNRMVFDALLKSYQGDYSKVFKHIRIERFTISKRYSSAAVTIEPQLHVDATMQQITMDKRLGSLPPSLQSLNLFNMRGEIIMANRGILEFSDLLKRPLDAFKYLLMTMESKTINIQGILTELDIFFIGSSNEIHLAAFKQHPDFNSFKGRINFVRVPYLLDAENEERIYQDQIKNLKIKTNFEPHALETLCLWSAMTRIRPCQPKNYEDRKFGELAASLSPLEKTLLISKGQIPERFSSEERQIFKTNMHLIMNEFENETLYEGKFGISPREIKQVIYEVASSYNHVTFMEVLEFLVKFTERKNEYDFLNIAQQGEFNNPIRFIEGLKDFQLNIFDKQLRDSLGLVDDRSYEDYICRYVVQINCLIKGEKIKNQVTGTFQEVDMYFVKDFETNINLKESPKTFRSHMISTLGAYSLDNPNKKIVYTDVFPDIVKSLKESFREEQKKVIVSIAKNLVFYLSEIQNPQEGRQTSLSEKQREQIKSIIRNLHDKYHYSEIGALTLLRNLIKEKY